MDDFKKEYLTCLCEKYLSAVLCCKHHGALRNNPDHDLAYARGEMNGFCLGSNIIWDIENDVLTVKTKRKKTLVSIDVKEYEAGYVADMSGA